MILGNFKIIKERKFLKKIKFKRVATYSTGHNFNKKLKLGGKRLHFV
jgi:hypothetical protein